jgi:hypothetical protein
MLRQRVRGCQYAGYILQVDAQNYVTGGTPLHSAAQESERGERKGDRGDKDGRIVCIKMLLEAGASLNIAVRIPPVRSGARKEGARHYERGARASNRTRGRGQRRRDERERT